MNGKVKKRINREMKEKYPDMPYREYIYRPFTRGFLVFDGTEPRIVNLELEQIFLDGDCLRKKIKEEKRRYKGKNV